MNSFDFICVSGYGKSGSGACVDLLKEFEYIGGLDKEFRMTKDPSGILDLESSLVENWEFVRHNIAIRDFLEYCFMLSRKDGIFKRVGKNYNDMLGVDFMAESLLYVEKLSDFIYYGDSLLNRYRLTATQSFRQRVRSKLGLDNSIQTYFSRPTKERFLLETKKYLKSIFMNYANNMDLQKVVLDQAVSPINIHKNLKYFCDAKMIIVDRDPRDIYTTMVNEKRLLGADYSHNKSPNKYIVWHKYVRSKLDNDNINQEKVLRLNFEDFFINYNKTIEKIKDFLDIDFEHKYKGERFNPDDMDKYVGIWKKNQDQESMSYIEKSLSEYCFYDCRR